VRSRAEGGLVQIVFQDDGPGIPQENVRRIFDPFFTTKQAGEGTGLGLTICYSIIDEHAGRIWAESAPGQGTTFVVELPVVTGEAPTMPPEELEEEARAVPTRSVLVVEDEESIQQLLTGLLTMDGHHVDVARNGLEALERVADRRYDVIITDIKMPEMDGQELYRRLQEQDPDLARRTVFITGDTVSVETRRFLERVSNPCLAKPFRMREVRETVERLIEQAD
jgi:two-component system NtrC family sensor kinase